MYPFSPEDIATLLEVLHFTLSSFLVRPVTVQEINALVPASCSLLTTVTTEIGNKTAILILYDQISRNRSFSAKCYVSTLHMTSLLIIYKFA